MTELCLRKAGRLVPVVEDWLARVCLLGVSLSFGLIIMHVPIY